MDGTTAPQIIEHTHRSLNFTPFEVKWIPCSARFLLMGQTPSAKGIFQMFQLDQKTEGKLKLLTEFTKGGGYKCATFGHSNLSERTVAMGDFQGNLTIYDLETQSERFNVKAHVEIINGIDGAGGNGYGPPEIVTGGRDGAVKVWDPRQNTPVLALEPAEDIKPECWTVAFGNSYNDTERMLAAGYDNGDIKLFDLRTNCLQWDHNLRNGICNLQFDRQDTMMNKLGATTLEGNFHIFDLRTYNAEEGYAAMSERANASTLWGIKHVPQNRDLFMILGGDGGLYFYKYRYPRQRQVQDANGNKVGVPGTVDLLNQRDVTTQPICTFDWNSEKLGLCAMACLDQTLRVYIVTKLNTY